MLTPLPQQALPPQALDQIAYCSIATRGLRAASMDDLITRSQHNNTRHGITGMIMRDGDLIIQWFEGSPDAVDRLWGMIQKDERHHCIVQLIHRQGVPQRLFANWSLQTASRNEMVAIIRQARVQAIKDQGSEPSPWQHAISTLSILIDPDLSAYYATALQTRRSDLAPSSPPALA
jgi:Sensors of blue-light using FAD